MIVKKEYKDSTGIKYTMTDGIDRIDSGTFDNGVKFVNIYKKDRKREDEFETIEIKSVILYVMNSEGKTLQIFR